MHELAYCLLNNCTPAIEKLSADCFQCLAQNPSRDPSELARACVAKAALQQSANKNGVRRGGGPESFRVYSGSFGTGLLTNAEIREKDALILPSVLDRRAVLYAKLETPVGELHVFCTHLTANIAGVPHPSRGSFQRD